MDRLDAMAVFVAVCDAKGFAPAARKLGLSPSVVTRLVAKLEERLGVRLLQRTTRSLSLTDAGTRYLERVRRVLGEVDAAEEAARGEREQLRGRLAVTAPVIFGRLHVAPLLRRYMGLYPEVTAELHLNDRNVHLVEEGIDVGIRIGVLQDSTLIARRLGATRRVLVASPAYLASRGRPGHPGELDAHDIIHFGPTHIAGEWTFIEPMDGAQREVRVAVRPRFATNSGDAAIDLAREDGGLVRALHYQVAPYVALGELEIVLAAYEPPPSPIHAVYPSARLLPARVRAFVDLASETKGWAFEAA